MWLRAGAVRRNVRYFRSAMTHAVDVDGLVWRFFSSEAEADACAADKRGEGYDAVVVSAKAYSADAHEELHSSSSFAEKLKSLMAARQLTADDLADALRTRVLPWRRRSSRAFCRGSVAHLLIRPSTRSPKYWTSILTSSRISHVRAFVESSATIPHVANTHRWRSILKDVSAMIKRTSQIK